MSSKPYFENEHFLPESIVDAIAAPAEFENCVFELIDFGGLGLRDSVFIDCQFIGCNMSNAPLVQTAFRNVACRDCKMQGLRFDHAHAFLLEMQFSGCVLDYSVFTGLALQKTRFINCSLREVDFTEANLSESMWSGSRLPGAVFDNTLLEKADFRTAMDYNIDPVNNYLKKARFSRDGVEGLLGRFGVVVED